jgi:hypothetical protein
MAFRLHLRSAEGLHMWNVLRQFFMFRIGQNTARGAARLVGLGRLATIAGLIGGYRYMRRHHAR